MGNVGRSTENGYGEEAGKQSRAIVLGQKEGFVFVVMGDWLCKKGLPFYIINGLESWTPRGALECGIETVTYIRG